MKSAKMYLIIKRLLGSVAVVLVVSTLLICSPVLADQLSGVTDKLTNQLAGALAAHTITFSSLTDISRDGKIVISFPNGFDVSGASLGNVTGPEGTFKFVISGQDVTITRNGDSVTYQGSVTINLNDIVNPKPAGMYAVTVSTYDANNTIVDGPSISTSFPVFAGKAMNFTITGSTSQVAGASNTLTITAQDGAGNIDTSYSGYKELTFTGAIGVGEHYPTVTDRSGLAVAIGSPTTLTFTEGISRVGGKMVLYRAGTAVIKAAAIGVSTPIPLSVTVIPETAAHLAYTGGSRQDLILSQLSAGLMLQRQDPYGNPTTSGTLTINLSTSSSGGAYYSGSGEKINSINISDGSSDAPIYYYKDTVVGNPTLTAKSVVLSNAITTFTIRVGSRDADLSGLTVSSGSLNPAFAAGTTRYTDIVAENVIVQLFGGLSYVKSALSVMVTPTASESHATIKINNSPVSSGSPGVVTLSAKDNPISIVVTAQDGVTTKTYTVTVTVAPAIVPPQTTPPPVVTPPVTTTTTTTTPPIVTPPVTTAPTTKPPVISPSQPAVTQLPASFSLSEVSISPAEVNNGESVGISVMVTNAGDVEGRYQIELRIDGAAKSSKTITLAGTSAQKVDFGTFQYDAGEHTVNINGKTATFNVLAVPTNPKSNSSGGWIIGSVIAFVIVLITTILIVWRRNVNS